MLTRKNVNKDKWREQLTKTNMMRWVQKGVQQKKKADTTTTGDMRYDIQDTGIYDSCTYPCMDIMCRPWPCSLRCTYLWCIYLWWSTFFLNVIQTNEQTNKQADSRRINIRHEYEFEYVWDRYMRAIPDIGHIFYTNTLHTLCKTICV